MESMREGGATERPIKDHPYPAASGVGGVGDGGREADDAAVARRRGDREAGVGGRVEAVGGGGERRGREGPRPGDGDGDGGGEGGRDELLGHGVELGEEVLQIPHLALPGGVGGASSRARRLLLLMARRCGVVDGGSGGGLDDGHRSRRSGRGAEESGEEGSGRFCGGVGEDEAGAGGRIYRGRQRRWIWAGVMRSAGKPQQTNPGGRGDAAGKRVGGGSSRG